MLDKLTIPNLKMRYGEKVPPNIKKQELIEDNKTHVDNLKLLFNDEQNKYKKTIEELNLKENQLKKLDENIF